MTGGARPSRPPGAPSPAGSGCSRCSRSSTSGSSRPSPRIPSAWRSRTSRRSSRRSRPTTSPSVNFTGDAIQGTFTKPIAYPPRHHRHAHPVLHPPAAAAGRRDPDPPAARARRHGHRRAGGHDAVPDHGAAQLRPGDPDRRALHLAHAALERGGHQRPRPGQVPRPQVRGLRPAGHLRRRRGDRRGQGRAGPDRRLPQGARALPQAGRPHPAGRAAHRAARNRQDPAGPRHRGRGGRPLLLDERLRVHRDDRGRRRVPGAGPLRPGQGGGAGDHLHRRARRDRPLAGGRRQLRRRRRRARADAQPDPHRDGRLRPAPPG